MNHQAESVSVATRASSAADDCLSTAIDDLDDDFMEDELEASTDELSIAAAEEEQPAEPVLPRMSYGIVDILFPMTPPKPKGARLIRGPLKFNQP
jgi:hypothetical protein